MILEIVISLIVLIGILAYLLYRIETKGIRERKITITLYISLLCLYTGYWMYAFDALRVAGIAFLVGFTCQLYLLYKTYIKTRGPLPALVSLGTWALICINGAVGSIDAYGFYVIMLVADISLICFVVYNDEAMLHKVVDKGVRISNAVGILCVIILIMTNILYGGEVNRLYDKAMTHGNYTNQMFAEVSVATPTMKLAVLQAMQSEDIVKGRSMDDWKSSVLPEQFIVQDTTLPAEEITATLQGNINRLTPIVLLEVLAVVYIACILLSLVFKPLELYVDKHQKAVGGKVC